MVTAMIDPKVAKVRNVYSLATAWAKAGPAASASSAATGRTRFFAFMIASSAGLQTGRVRVARDRVGHGVELARLARVEPCDAPGDQELRQREDEAEIDHAPDLHAVEIGEVSRTDRQEEVVDHREGHQAPQEARLPRMELLEAGIRIDRGPVH